MSTPTFSTLHEQRLQMAIGEAPTFTAEETIGPLLSNELENPRILKALWPHFGPFLSFEEWWS